MANAWKLRRLVRIYGIDTFTKREMTNAKDVPHSLQNDKNGQNLFVGKHDHNLILCSKECRLECLR